MDLCGLKTDHKSKNRFKLAIREHGDAVTLSVGEGARQSGLTLSLSPRWGAPATASDALWQDQLFLTSAPSVRRARLDYGLQVGLLLRRLGPVRLEVSGERYALLHPGRDEYRMSASGSSTLCLFRLH